MIDNRPSFILRYAVALLVVGVAVALELLITMVVPHRTVVPLIFASVVISALYGGLGPALLSAIVASLSVNYFFIHQDHSLGFSIESVLQLILFGGTSFLISTMTSRLRDTRGHQRFLSQASAILATSLDYQQTLTSIARLAVPRFGDWCSIEIIDDQGVAQPVAVEHVDPAKVAWAHELRRQYPPDPNAKSGVPNVIRTGQPEFVPVITDAMLVAASRDEEQLKLARQVGFTSYMVVPLIARNRTIGALTLVAAESNRHYNRGDLALAQELASRAALAVDNARLYSNVVTTGESLRVTLQSIGDAVITTDARQQVTFLNPVAEMLTGWSNAAGSGQPLDKVFSIINEETRLTVESPATRVLREGVVVGLANHTLLVARDGTEIPIDDSGAPIRDDQGKIGGVVLVFRSVAERRAADREMQRLMLEMGSQRRRIDAIVANVPGVVWETWAQPDSSQQRIDFVSDYVESMIGYSVAEWISTPQFWLTIVHPDDRERAASEAAEIMASGRVGKSQFRWIRRDGRVIWVEAQSAVVVDERGNSIGMRGVTMDITDRKLAELETQKARETAEHANLTKTQFLAVLSHELRTPLTPVLASVELLKGEGLDPSTRQLVELIDRNVQLEARLIDDLLDLTRITNGKMQLTMSTVDVAALLRNAIEICSADIESKRQLVVIDLSAHNHYVHGDPARLQQVFWNLIKNAIKFTPDGGHVTVRTQDINGDRLLVEVMDSGIGIEPEVLPRIFNAFEQGEQRITRQFGGLGLGLTISNMLIDMHGGTLTAASEGTNRGSRFTVELAAVAPAETESQAMQQQGLSDSSRRSTILIVEDHADTSNVMRMLLERRGYHVLSAFNVQSALLLAEKQPFDLLISDIGLPDGSGIELLRELSRRNVKVKAIALSGFGMEEDIRKSREAGFAEHLVKPIDFKRLNDVIEAMLG